MKKGEEMDALEFLKAKEKMCRMHPVCIDCPAKGMDCVGFDSDATNFKKLVQVVEEWSQERPAKTRQSVFLERYPNATMDGGVLFCPKNVDKTYSPILGCRASDCCDCCRDYWMKEVE